MRSFLPCASKWSLRVATRFAEQRLVDSYRLIGLCLSTAEQAGKMLVTGGGIPTRTVYFYC
jgi:hypothetical protein